MTDVAGEINPNPMYYGNVQGGSGPQSFPARVTELYDQMSAVQRVVNVNGVADPMEIDLLAMKSPSLAWKVSVIRKREAERRTIIEDLRNQIEKLTSGLS